MKLHFIKSPLILVLSLALASCLKDKAFDNGEIQSGAGETSTIEVVSIGLTVSNTSNFLVVSFDNSTSDTTIDLIPVELGGTSAASKDLHVTLTPNNTLIDDYNTANGTNYVVPDASILTVADGGVVTIPKGTRTGFLKVTFKPSDFLSAPYAVGYTISSVAEPGYTISGNLQNGIVAIGVKNQFDGQYNMTINTIGWAAYGIADNMPGPWPSLVSMVTSGATSVTFNTKEEGSLEPALTSAGGPTGFGATQPQFIFDATTNALTNVKNLAADDGRGRAFHLNAAVTDSRFDPATRTIYAAYIMVQNGRPDQQIYDTLVYVKPR